MKAKATRLPVTPFDLHTIPPSVAVVADVSEGLRYNLNSIAFREDVFSAEPPRQQFEFTDGDIFNAETIRVGLDSIRQLYTMQGLHKTSPRCLKPRLMIIGIAARPCIGHRQRPTQISRR